MYGEKYQSVDETHFNENVTDKESMKDKENGYWQRANFFQMKLRLKSFNCKHWIFIKNSHRKNIVLVYIRIS